MTTEPDILGIPASEFKVTKIEQYAEPDNTDPSTLTFSDHPMVKAVTDLFKRAGHPQPEAWLEGHTERYVSDPVFTRTLINNRLIKVLRRLELYGDGAKSSLAIRATLDNDGDINDWLTNIEHVVIPFMIDNDLPIPPRQW